MIDEVIKSEAGTYFPTREQYYELIGELKKSGYEYCSDLCAVDYLEQFDRALPEGVQAERFEVVVILTSVKLRSRIRVRVQVPETDPSAPTLFHHYPGTEAMEREAYDLMGIVFAGHPDMTRILMPEEWEGHPLRKDYSAERVPVQFKHSPAIR
ncbi:MAG: NADH-quinone oxidoreductase subunit C [Actinomycetota bacterium]|nr:NADH-quinone oxidoreductase subunit C [Actinomycetota bacterium]